MDGYDNDDMLLMLDDDLFPIEEERSADVGQLYANASGSDRSAG